MKSRFPVILFIVLVLSGPGKAQSWDKPLGTTSKKAARSYEAAVRHYAVKNLSGALKEAERAVDADPGFIEAWLLMGDVFSETGNKPEAIDAYERAVALDRNFFPSAFFILGNLEMSSGLYQKAGEHYRAYLGFENISEDRRQVCLGKLKSSEFAAHSVGNPVPFAPLSLGPAVNSADDEYMNAVTVDEQWLYFTRKLPKADPYSRMTRPEEDFYVSVMTPGGWSEARSLGPPVNTAREEGALFISPDGMQLYFAGCYYPDGLGSCDIYHAWKNGDQWSVPENLGEPLNSQAWDSQPAFAADGKTLFFASKRSGGLGSSDLWMSELQVDGSWSAPRNLGNVINTAQAEMCPFIHPDGKTLYFSSAGHPGLGGLDLFYSRKDSAGNWSIPNNLGYPVNTLADEINIIVNAAGNRAYISTDKLDGYGKSDIYSFELYPEARPASVTYLKGKVFDALTRQPLAARFELIDLASGSTLVASDSEPAGGEFLVALPVGGSFALNVSKSGYLFYSGHFSPGDNQDPLQPYRMNVPLQPVRTGEIVTLNNIFFETDKADLQPASMAELERLKSLLEKNPGLTIEIRGHTDNTGSDEHNAKLSDSRARVVQAYLLERGIRADRLTYKGFGATLPVAGNDTPSGRQQNRRTEFRVTGQ